MVMAPVLLVYQLAVPEVLVVVEVLVPAPVDLGQQGVVVSHQTRYTVHGVFSGHCPLNHEGETNVERKNSSLV